ncbi:hypothetical protein JIR001_07920 [Polycladomyces abyssicola]|uniref:Uncharacterized protein n=1 Tax=Polycladomyces abyssicola TaxID=1125966 RepID=A0A8D5UEU7_9BACL|nr:hypothetical protein [Polycladomyces abyssicola]BCU81009.1 hypothetical protein JIR001_07920 [Polycladomyces abyssicola]
MTEWRIVRFHGYTVKADPDTTHKLIRELPNIGEKEHCNCQGCSNYALATEHFPFEVKKLFALLGMDPVKEGHVTRYFRAENGLTGEILEQPSEWPVKVYYKNETDHFLLTLTQVLPNSHIPTHLPFPEPWMELYIEAYLPWLLEEEYEDWTLEKEEADPSDA